MERKMERCGGKKERRSRDKTGSKEALFFFEVARVLFWVNYAASLLPLVSAPLLLLLNFMKGASGTV